MHTVELVVLGVAIAALAVGWLLRRFGVRRGDGVQLFGGLLIRAVAGVVFLLEATHALHRGGVWFDLVALMLAVLGVFTLVVAAVLLWALLTGRAAVDE
jgi:hypothetical protein